MDIKTQQEIAKAIDILIKERLKNLSFNYYVRGIVQSVDTVNGIYTVKINDSASTLKALDGKTYSVNDVVFILVVNGNFSEKYIDHKIP